MRLAGARRKLDRRMRAKTARVELDPVALDRGSPVFVGAVGRPRGPDHPLESVLTVDRTPIHDGARPGKERALNPSRRREAHLDRLAV